MYSSTLKGVNKWKEKCVVCMRTKERETRKDICMLRLGVLEKNQEKGTSTTARFQIFDYQHHHYIDLSLIHRLELHLFDTKNGFFIY
jgi:hypothetical protein